MNKSVHVNERVRIKVSLKGMYRTIYNNNTGSSSVKVYTYKEWISIVKVSRQIRA